MELKIQENIRQLTVSAADIKIKSNDRLMIGSNTIKMGADAFKDVLNIAGINKKVINHINETMDDGQSGYVLVQMVIKHLTSRKNTKLKLVIDITANEVIRIVDENSMINAIPLQSFEQLLEMIQKDSPGKIVVYDPVIMDGGTKVSVQLKWDQSIPLIFKGENISVGKQFTYDMFGNLTYEELVERLTCTNGMTGIVPGYSHVIDMGSGVSDWYRKIMKDLKSPNQDFIKNYEKLILEAKQSNLSVNEYNMVKFHMSHWAKDSEIIRKYLGDENWKSDYDTRGIDLTKLSKEQLKNCPTPVNKWDAVNLMTDLSSHVYNSFVDGRTMRATQKLAGQFLRRTSDEDRFVYNVPTYRNTVHIPELLIIDEQ